jgi:hypothetical protein
VVQVTPSGVANLGWKFYLIWIAITSVSVPFLYFCYPEPETPGVTLEEMDDFFAVERSWNVSSCKNIKQFLETQHLGITAETPPKRT